MENANDSSVPIGADIADRKPEPAAIDIPTPKKRGRPKGSGKKGGEGNPSPVAQTSNSGPGVARADPSYFVTTAIMLFELGDDYMRSRLLAKLARYMPEKKEEFIGILDKQAFNEKDREMLTHTLTALALKYDILSKFGPEVGIVIFLGQYSFRMSSLFALVESFKPKAQTDAGKN